MAPHRITALVLALVVLVPALVLAANPVLSLQKCEAGFAAETFAIGAPVSGGFASVVQTSTKTCVGVTSGSDTLELQPCTGSANQQWLFRSDGTVQSNANQGQCWNVLGGSTSDGSSMGVWTCDQFAFRGDRAQIAANDVFAFLPSNGLLFANESQLCVSSAAVPCAGDVCCTLNGKYDPSTQTCACYAPWSGPACAVLDFLPAQGPASGYGMSPNLTSWGGNIILGPDNLYHLYVAEMANDCPLTDWGSNSQCVHATSPTAEGPFRRESVAIPIWCHNPQIVVSQNGSQTVYVLFHIGLGNGGDPVNCNKTGYAVGSTLHVSSSPFGPFVPVQLQPPSCNNPAPMQHPNGSWYLVCDSTTLYSAPSYQGPWSNLGNLNPSGPGIPATYEDAFLYLDPRGNWHILFHAYTTDTVDTCVGSVISAHMFSVDGLHWLNSPHEPYSNQVNFTDGTSRLLSTRERPKMLFGKDGNPSHLITGSCGTPFCGTTPCVNCKYDFWDFTLVQPLNYN